MTRHVDYEWRLRLLLAERGIFSHKQLTPLLAEHGLRMSDSQTWRLVTGKPERLNLHLLMVLCQILECTPSDLIQPLQAATSARLEKRVADGSGGKQIIPKRARINGARGRTDG